MAKDPAILFYKDAWLMATAEMDSDVRGWYINLIIHNFDKNDLPNDIEKLAVLAGVKFSEFERFKKMFNEVLKHKFKANSNGRLENENAARILQAREEYKEKRTRSANIAVVIKAAIKIVGTDTWKINKLKSYLFSLSDADIEKHKNNQMLNQVLNQMDKHKDNLYINENENENKDIDVIELNTLPMFDKITNIDFLQMCRRVSDQKGRLTDLDQYKKEYFRLLANRKELHEQSGRSEEWLVINAKKFIKEQSAINKEYDNYADFFSHFLNWTRKQPK